MPDTVSGLRVALVAGLLGRGGAEKQLLACARALREAGCEVELFTLAPGGCYDAAFRELGICPRHIARSSLRLGRVCRLIREFRRFRPHVVHSGHAYANLYAGVAGRATGALVIGSLRGSYAGSRREYGMTCTLLFRLPHALVTNSVRTYTDLLRNRAVTCERVYLLPNGVELPQRPAERRVRAAGAEVRALFVGRLVPGKRLERFLAALAMARRLDQRIRGIVAGDGPAMASARRLAAELGLTSDHLTFLGETGDVPAQLEAADFLVFTSEDEGLPNAVLEAMAAGLPVITTAAGDAGLVVQHGLSGFVVSSGEPEQIAAHMLQLAACPEMAERMGRAGRAYVAEHYSASLLRDRLLHIYATAARRARADRIVPLIPLCSSAA